MKKIFTIFICILIYQSGKSQDLTKIDIVGEWQFIELQDENGVKQTKIPLNRWQKDAVEKVNRDSYVFDSSTNEINLELRIDSEDPALESLKKHNLVTKRQDGSYYQKAVKKLILDCSEQTMKIKDREEYVLIYKRVNEKK